MIEEKVRQLLLGKGYRSEGAEPATHRNLIDLAQGHLNGLVLFQGEVICSARIRATIRDNEGYCYWLQKRRSWFVIRRDVCKSPLSEI